VIKKTVALKAIKFSSLKEIIPPNEIYSSNWVHPNKPSYYVPRIGEFYLGEDGEYLSLLLYRCWACGGHDPKRVLINLETKEAKELGFVRSFWWHRKNGDYSFRKLVYEKCEDQNTLTTKRGPLEQPFSQGQLYRLVETESEKSEKGNFDNVQYQDIILLENTKE